MKKIFPLLMIILCCMTASAQNQTFDVVSYTMPKGWQQQKSDAGIQLSVSDKKTGVYAIAVITKAKASTASASDNFNNDWLKLVKGSVQVNGEADMQAPTNENGWNVISGSANYSEGATTGAATLLTATGGQQTVSVVMMTNTQQYQNDLVSFINSLKLSKALQNKTVTTQPATTSGAGKVSLAGLWVDYQMETTGNYVNGAPQYTAGYTRREYAFYSDGTYLFRTKQWLTTMKQILFIYESGTYSINGNQLTITPKQGKGQWWNKSANNRTDEWGTVIKSSEFTIEKVAYSFEIKYYSGSQDYTLILKPGKPTQREGGKFNTPNEFHYSLREKLGSLIDNPPGLKTGFENRSFTSSSSTQTNNTTAGNTVSSPLVGKIWEASSPEKFGGGGTMNDYYTGGFSTGQYKFNADGTYVL